jgi:hypothetical protein
MKGKNMSFKNPNKLKKPKITVKKVTIKPAKGKIVPKPAARQQ